jgi:hypothetical protein
VALQPEFRAHWCIEMVNQLERLTGGISYCFISSLVTVSSSKRTLLHGVS